MAVQFWDPSFSELPPTGGVSWNQLDQTKTGSPFDCVRLGKWDVPGICKIVSAKSERVVVSRKAKGSNGAHQTYNGYKPSEVVIETTIWTPPQYQQLQLMLADLWPRKDQAPNQGVSIYHPELQLLGINSVIIAAIDLPKQGDQWGTRIFTIKCIEYFPPKKGAPAKKATLTPVQVTKQSAVLLPSASETTKPKNQNGTQSIPPSATDGGPNQSVPSGQQGET